MTAFKSDFLNILRERGFIHQCSDFEGLDALAAKGEAALERVAAGAPGSSTGVSFSRLRAEFTRNSGQLSVREGVVKGPAIGATIEGNIDYVGNTVRMFGRT